MKKRLLNTPTPHSIDLDSKWLRFWYWNFLNLRGKHCCTRHDLDISIQAFVYQSSIWITLFVTPASLFRGLTAPSLLKTFLVDTGHLSLDGCTSASNIRTLGHRSCTWHHVFSTMKYCCYFYEYLAWHISWFWRELHASFTVLLGVCHEFVAPTIFVFVLYYKYSNGCQYK